MSGRREDFDPAEITASLDLAVRRGGDITPRVYARLFASHPEMEPLFVRDTTGAVKGEMLARVAEAVLDFIDARAYAHHLIQCEVLTHEGYGVPRDVFPAFFGTLADTVRDLVGPEWTDGMERSWRALLAELDWYVAHPDQSVLA